MKPGTLQMPMPHIKFSRKETAPAMSQMSLMTLPMGKQDHFENKNLRKVIRLFYEIVCPTLRLPGDFSSIKWCVTNQQRSVIPFPITVTQTPLNKKFGTHPPRYPLCIFFTQCFLLTSLTSCLGTEAFLLYFLLSFLFLHSFLSFAT